MKINRKKANNELYSWLYSNYESILKRSDIAESLKVLLRDSHQTVLEQALKKYFAVSFLLMLIGVAACILYKFMSNTFDTNETKVVVIMCLCLLFSLIALVALFITAYKSFRLMWVIAKENYGVKEGFLEYISYDIVKFLHREVVSVGEYAEFIESQNRKEGD